MADYPCCAKVGKDGSVRNERLVSIWRDRVGRHCLFIDSRGIMYSEQMSYINASIEASESRDLPRTQLAADALRSGV